MKKYLHLLGYEMRTLLRDPLNLFMLFYPLFMLFLTGWLLPTSLHRAGLDTTSHAYALTMLIEFVMVLAIGGFAMGILLGFSLLENKDEQTILSIAVTPIKVSGYILFKTVYAYVFSIVGNLVMLFGIQLFAHDAYSFQYGNLMFGFDNISGLDIFAFSLVASLLVPSIGALTAAISRNKIEGFAFMKSGGLLFMIPALVLLNAFSGWKQYLLGFAPNFWPLKGLLNLALGSQDASDLPYWAYLVIGAGYMVFLGGIAIRFFIKKAGLERN